MDRYRTAPGWIAQIASEHLRRREDRPWFRSTNRISARKVECGFFRGVPVRPVIADLSARTRIAFASPASPFSECQLDILSMGLRGGTISAPAQFAGQFRESGSREAPPGGFCRGYVARIRCGARGAACDPGWRLLQCRSCGGDSSGVIRTRPRQEGVCVG